MAFEDYLCRTCHCSMHVPDGMDPLEEDVRFCPSCAADEIESLRKAIGDALHKLTCVAIERQCVSIPEIVRVCVSQAEHILSEAAEKARA